MRARFPYSDYSKNRIIGGLGYVLFFLPLLLCPDSKYGRFCANQGLIGLIAILLIMVSGWILNLIIGWIPLIGWLARFVIGLLRAVVSIVMIVYAVFAICNDDERELPLIGGYTILR